VCVCVCVSNDVGPGKFISFHAVVKFEEKN